ncbi:MAG TPA: 30S ribosomal protein S15 [Candidatus Pacearchaeota archaeon]|nr:30S ribosomal protein S15 [Candidatus Pacearchaeota archaeon]HOK94372.1 30S ribosomal protein S15 [Candidatus Pacearchaeota archaeon]HPO75302.1 30S ribosomal protein S15 [Candidatus Pacearchaeota archaeon]
MTKQEIIKQYQIHETDTGSAEVQISLLTDEIQKLTEHLKRHPKDNNSRRSLLKKVAQRRKLLNYLKRENEKRYNAILKKLKL